MDKFPEKQVDDYVYGGTKAALNLIPDVGRSLSAIFETVFSSPLDKRKEKWFKELAQIVEELSEKVDGLTLENLSNNEEFISFYLQASNIALRTHHEEKLKVLSSSVKNCILLKNIDESKKLIFLRVIDQMTPLHIKILHFLIFPEIYIQELNSRQPPNVTTHWGGLGNVWDELFNEDIRSSNHMIDIVIMDLKNWGLVHVSSFGQASLSYSSGTQFGKEFMKFIDKET